MSATKTILPSINNNNNSKSSFTSFSAMKPLQKLKTRGSSEHQSALSTQQSNNSLGSSQKLSSRMQSNTSQRSTNSLTKKVSGLRQRIDMSSKYASAEKRKLVCSLPRHTSVREQSSASKANVRIFNQKSANKSRERISHIAHIDDEPATQIPAIFSSTQKLINPGKHMLKSVSQNRDKLSTMSSSKQSSAAELPIQATNYGFMDQHVLENKKAVLDKRFELIRKIDEGTYAKVYFAKDHKYNGKEVVVKLLRSRAMSSASEREQVKCEMRNHDVLNHKHIIQMLGGSMKGEMYIWGKKQDQRFVYLVTEYLGNEFINMFDLIEICMGNGISEDAGRYFMKQMLSALDYLHSDKDTCHRDLKLENILIDKNVDFKILDFGLSCKGNVTNVTGAVGSPNYVAPEILTNKHYDGTKADIFSLGVLLFIIVIGKFPHGQKILNDRFYKLIAEKRYDEYLKLVQATHTSKEFKELIFSLLAKDPAERPSVKQILNSKFIKDASYNEERVNLVMRKKMDQVLAK